MSHPHGRWLGNEEMTCPGDSGHTPSFVDEIRIKSCAMQEFVPLEILSTLILLLGRYAVLSDENIEEFSSKHGLDAA